MKWRHFKRIVVYEFRESEILVFAKRTFARSWKNIKLLIRIMWNIVLINNSRTAWPPLQFLRQFAFRMLSLQGCESSSFSWFPLWKFSCVKISAFSFIFSIFLAFFPDFTIFFLVFCMWPLTPLSLVVTAGSNGQGHKTHQGPKHVVPWIYSWTVGPTQILMPFFFKSFSNN